MHDKFLDFKNSQELKFSREQGFFDKSRIVRLLIGLLFILSLFVFLHFREVRVEVLELNSIAPGYVVAQTDFDFLDEERSYYLREEAVRDIGKIYRLSEQEIRKRRLEFDSFLVSSQDWRSLSENSNFEEMYRGADALERALIQLRLTDPRTLQHLKEIGQNVAYYQVYTPSDISEPVKLPSSIWKKIIESTFSVASFQKSTGNFITGYFENKTWSLEEDLGARRALVRKIQSQIPDFYTKMEAGSHIIDQGQKVTTRHTAMLQAMKNAMSEKRNLWHPLTLLGTLILTLALAGLSIAYCQVNHPQLFSSNRKLFLLVTITIITLFFAKVIEFFLLNSKNNLIEVVRYPLLVPFAAILLCSLMNSGIATFTSGFLTIVLTLGLAFERQGFMLMNIAAAVVAILSTRSLHRRKEIFVVCLKAWLYCVLIILSIHFYHNSLGHFSLFADLISTGIFMLLTAILVVGFLPLLESGFGIMTDVSLMEYMDPNSDLLRRLSIEAPGTYQHSIVVGNLAEAAALAIGANGLFCRAATLYHDVGKMATPQYFTENQYNGMNIHQLLTPKESAQVIIAHVSEGVALARKAGLPEQFIDIIKEHHGTTLVYYFYRKALEKQSDELVDEKEYRYSGPKPRSKESAIIMIADSLEAASRSLDVVNEETLTALAGRLIRDKADDGQFDECLLTLEEMAIVKHTLVKTLVAYGHSRVKYPPTREPLPSDMPREIS